MLGRFEAALVPSSDFRRMAIPAAAAPSGEARALMRDRLALVEGWLAPAGAAEVDRMIGSLMQVMAAPATSEDSQRIALGLYRSVLAPLPAWAVGAACRRFLDGTAGGGTFAPTPAELANEVRAITAKQVDERARLMRVLDAEILPAPDPEAVERARQAAADAIAGKLMREQQDQRRAVETEEQERDAVLAGPPLKAGALGSAALGRFLPAHPARRTSGQPTA
ncbi:hypothetical protein ACQVP2_27410 [Methylobacterium aquaticum]|uniref:hypothetical protein n=1 Tax=Methylobacterium aquaticum TaxID=270351 RepID=UPI003D16977D